MSRIYILSTHDEYGAEDVKATTDRADVVDMLRSYVGEKIGGYDQCYPEFGYGEIDSLASLMDADKVGAYSLSNGWGGFQLHIVDVFQPKSGSVA